MTQDEIIRTAREAGWSKEYLEIGDERLERFAALVAEATKEKAAIAGGAAAMAGLSFDEVAEAIRGIK